MKPEKVKDKEGKARIRQGSRDARGSIATEEPSDVHRFINRIICGDAQNGSAPNSRQQY